MSDAPRSILIVRLSALGDVVHVLPSLAALRRAFPTAKIGWVTEEGAATLLEGHPHIDRLHVVPRKTWIRDLGRGAVLQPMGALRRKIAELRAERYDVALDFQSNFRSGLVTWLSRARRRIGQPAPLSKEGSRWFFTDVAPAIPFEAHKIERNLNLLAPLGIDTRPARGVLASGDARSLRTLLPENGERRRVVLHPGVSPAGAVKAWRPDRFAQLGARLIESGYEVFFSWGGATERLQAEHLVEAAPGARVLPETTLRQLVELLRAVDLFVGVDSGPLHLAAALGTPALGLYGPKHVSTYGPYWPGGHVVAADYPCSPCRVRRCPRPEVTHVQLANGRSAPISPCMDTISVDAVHASAVALLERSCELEPQVSATAPEGDA